MRLVAALDSLARLSDERKEALFGTAWAAMRGMRNRLVHGYAAVDGETVRVTVRDELPDIIARLAHEIQRLAGEQSGT